MDLLTRCKMCLQCLPFFHDSPPPSPRPVLPAPPPPLPLAEEAPPPAAAAAAAEEELPEAQIEEKNSNGVEEEPSSTVVDPFKKDEKSSSSDADLPHQQQDLPLSEDYTELGSPVYYATMGPEGAIEEEATASAIIIAPAVTTYVGISPPVNPEVNKTTVASELPLQLPFINDIEFSTAGWMPLPSPITPAPFGSAYLAGQQHAHHPIYHEHHHDHALHHHGHDLSHSHDHLPPPHPPLESSQSAPGHVPPPHPPLESSQSDHDPHEHSHHHHPHDHASEHDAPPQTPLETSQSAPDLELVNKPQGENGGTDEVTTTNGSSSFLETSQSEPIVGVSDDDGHGLEPLHAVRRRDQLKHQLLDLSHQLKQGGHHLKEEGGRHVQNMLNNMSKQAQQLEESGSFFIVPRGNNN